MNKDSKLIELSCKEVLMSIVKESKSLDKKISFFQKTLLFDKIKEMKYEKVIGLLFNEGVEVTTEQKNEFESKTKKIAKYGAVAGLGAYGLKRIHNIPNAPEKVKAAAKKFFTGPSKMKSFSLQKKGTRTGLKGAAAAIAGLYLYRKLSDPCVRKNLGNKQAQMACKMEAIKKVVSQIKSDIGRCSGAADPVKCKQKLSSELIKWQTKYQQYLVQMTKTKKNK
jgi:hypothetical protein